MEDSSNSSSSKAEFEKYISMEELGMHNRADDLWISIQGKVYDVTTWQIDHPGGDIPLLNMAGKDATDAFLAYHPGTAWRHLHRFRVGRLRDYSVSEVSRDYRRLATEFSRLGFFEEKGHGILFSFCFVLLLLSISIYGVVASSSPWVHLACGCIMGFTWIQSGWIGHDSGHYQVMTNAFFNRVAQLLTGNCLAGISIGWWKRNHNAHHIACNSLDHDPDLQHMPLFVVSSKFFSSITSCYYDRKMNFDAIARFFVSYQHWTFYPVMCVARFNLYGQSIVLLLSTNKKVPNRGQEILGLVIFWVWFPFLVSFLPTWGERIMFVLASFAVTGIQHVQFCLNHFSGNVYMGTPNGHDWFQKQTEGTVDISCPSWMDWFHGGLQFQVEHHLFPRLPRCHLRRISPLVRDLCKKHNLPYNSVSFWKANVLTIGILRAAAFQARDLANPIPKNLVWEAVNTHG